MRPTAALVLGLGLSGCIGLGSLFAQPPPLSDLSTAPPAVANRAPLPDCGQETPGYGQGQYDDVVRHCFWDAYQAGTPAEFRTFSLSGELQETWVTISRIEADGSVVQFVYTDSHMGGPTPWVRYDCQSLTHEAGQPYFAIWTEGCEDAVPLQN